MESSLEKYLASVLQERRAANLYRERKTLESPQTPELIVEGKNYLAFCSNDYLGLAYHPQIIEAFQQAAARYGVGSGASHLVAGHSHEHHALEEELAAFTGRERALLFSTGYMANLGTITALVGAKDAIFEDRLNHASLLDAGLLSGARFQRFLHNDIKNLEQRLQKTDAQHKLIVVDGVFSMDGDLAPLDELAITAQKHDAWLMVDDAHGFGCLGETGAGCAEYFNLNQQQLPILMGTLGKAAGTAGAFVAGSHQLIETLIQLARPYIYTTAMPPAVAAATRKSVQLIAQESWRREHLQSLINQFRKGAAQLGLPLMESSSAIQPLMLGEESVALAIAQQLRERGVLITAIRPPTVPAGTSRLRITFSAAHTEQQIDYLLQLLDELIPHALRNAHG